jgi:hypothetical protein
VPVREPQERRERVRRMTRALERSVSVHCRDCAQAMAERIVRDLEGNTAPTLDG